MLLLPENIRIRRYNLQTDEYHDFLQEEERIVALDYDWDHNNTGLSMYSILGPQPLKNVITPVLCIMEAHFKIRKKKHPLVNHNYETYSYNYDEIFDFSYFLIMTLYIIIIYIFFTYVICYIIYSVTTL